MPKKSKLLIQGDYPLIASPALAKAHGVAASIFLQKLHYCLQNSEAKKFQGRKFFYHSYENWVETLGYYSISTIKRIVTKLKKLGILIVKKLSSSKWLQTNFYSIDYQQLKKVLLAKTPETDNSKSASHTVVDVADVPDESKSSCSLKKRIIVSGTSKIVSSSNKNMNPTAGLPHPLQPMAPSKILETMPAELRCFYHQLLQKKVDVHYDDARLSTWFKNKKFIIRHVAFIKESFGHLRHQWHSPEQLGLDKLMLRI